MKYFSSSVTKGDVVWHNSQAWRESSQVKHGKSEHLSFSFISFSVYKGEPATGFSWDTCSHKWITHWLHNPSLHGFQTQTAPLKGDAEGGPCDLGGPSPLLLYITAYKITNYKYLLESTINNYIVDER